ncbi:MAG: CDP-diacylglycerol--glycerol-3-phosphate 3-phosphatidyltransferase [Fibromonadaceae bacterium]|jgi:CDP-diacylglycerol--glycerol-3-phosphate 3-phosphatidyltransferase|nr:CDP-diacylglycerol--glycerol-3-phosphate 3-phosphatidyltransferase [Fibromonadaceae bacterium]
MPRSFINKLFYGRVLRVTRLLAYLLVFYFIWEDYPRLAAASISVILIVAWYLNFRIRLQDIERPYYQLWLSFVEGLFAFVVMLCIFIRNSVKEQNTEIMLAVGSVFLLARVVTRTLYLLSMLREGKSFFRSGFWARAATLSINTTMLVYVLNLEHYQQISIGTAMLFMFASAVSFCYRYYRDPAHRKPLSVSNQLTMSRIVLTPVFIWVFFYDNNLNYQDNSMIFKILALVMIIAFMVTDFLDGYLARKWGEVSTLGKYLDPFSDKISNMTVFICFLASGYASVWMVALIYFREASVETLRTLAASDGITLPARRSGKWKTAIQGTGILIILVGALDPLMGIIPHWDEIWEYLPKTVMGIITFITLASGIDYFVSCKDVLKKYV